MSVEGAAAFAAQQLWMARGKGDYQKVLMSKLNLAAIVAGAIKGDRLRRGLVPEIVADNPVLKDLLADSVDGHAGELAKFYLSLDPDSDSWRSVTDYEAGYATAVLRMLAGWDK